MYGQNALLAQTINERSAQVLGEQYAARGSASAQFWRAMTRGEWQRLLARLMRRPTALTSLEMASQGRTQGRYAGIRYVPIDAIVGSENRVKDFDRWFNPRCAHVSERWISMAAAYDQGVTLPPVQLIEVNGAYFVRDGHHRISVARANGQRTIEAEVIVWNGD